LSPWRNRSGSKSIAAALTVQINKKMHKKEDTITESPRRATYVEKTFIIDERQYQISMSGTSGDGEKFRFK
jgi:hypothetical protein